MPKLVRLAASQTYVPETDEDKKVFDAIKKRGAVNRFNQERDVVTDECLSERVPFRKNALQDNYPSRTTTVFAVSSGCVGA